MTPATPPVYQIAPTKPSIVVCGGHNYEELYRMVHDGGMRCKNPSEFMKDMFSVLQNRDSFHTELPEFIHDVLDGAYVDHHIYYLSFDKNTRKAADSDDASQLINRLRGSDDQRDFSRTILSNLAIDARWSLLNIHNQLRAGGYYTPDGNFPYVLQDFSSRALSFRSLY